MQHRSHFSQYCAASVTSLSFITDNPLLPYKPAQSFFLENTFPQLCQIFNISCNSNISCTATKSEHCKAFMVSIRPWARATTQIQNSTDPIGMLSPPHSVQARSTNCSMVGNAAGGTDSVESWLAYMTPGHQCVCMKSRGHSTLASTWQIRDRTNQPCSVKWLKIPL